MAFNPVEFAKLMARFDTGNGNEAEAMSAARVMRRMVVKEGLRFVDVMERADVKKALDTQLQPVREDPPELREAFDKITELAEMIAREREIAAKLRQQVTAQREECESLRSFNRSAFGGQAGTRAASNGHTARAAGVPSGGPLINGWLVGISAALALALMIASAFQ